MFKNINKQIIRDEYTNQKLSKEYLANKYNITIKILELYLHIEGITRSGKITSKISLISEQELKHDYIDLLMTKEKLCQKYDLKMIMLNTYLYIKGIHRETHLCKHYISKEDLTKVYYNHNLSNKDMCKIFNCSEPILRKYRKKYKLKNRYDYSKHNKNVSYLYTKDKKSVR